MSERLTVAEVAAALIALGPEVQDYEVWHEADPSTYISPTDITVNHERRIVWL